MVHACSPSLSEAEAGRPGIQSHLWLHTVFKASLGYMRPCLRNRNKEAINFIPHKDSRRVRCIEV